jgi:hypothetical protein
MSRSYFSWEESEAYKEGRNDEERHRTNYNYEKYSDEPKDRAYFDGRKDQEREDERREEETRELREQEEREERRREEQRMQEEQEFDAQMTAQMEDDYRYDEMMARQNEPDYPEPPSEMPTTEEELFHDIQKNEINDSLDKIEEL